MCFLHKQKQLSTWTFYHWSRGLCIGLKGSGEFLVVGGTRVEYMSLTAPLGHMPTDHNCLKGEWENRNIIQGIYFMPTITVYDIYQFTYCFLYLPLSLLSCPHLSSLFSCLHLSSLALTFPLLPSPLLSCPHLSSLALTSPLLPSPLLSCPLLSSLALSSPLLPSPLLPSPLLSCPLLPSFVSNFPFTPTLPWNHVCGVTLNGY